MIDTPPLPATQQALDELRTTPAVPVRYRQRPAQWQWVDLKGECAGGRVEILLNPGMGVIAALQTTAGICAHLHELIRAWNLEDDQGQPLPVSPVGVGKLEPAESAAILDAWADARELSKRR